VFLLLLPSFCFGQNLVPNPSFEDTVQCPSSIGQVNRSVGWSQSVSADYFHSCSPIIGGASVPKNGFGYQLPATGQAYCGFYSYYSPNGSNIREVIHRALLSTMSIGVKYYVTLKFSGGDYAGIGGWSDCVTNNLGVLFSTVQYSTGSPAPIGNFSHVYTTSVVNDTLGWVTVLGAFVADSAYQYINIGNFFKDSATVILPHVIGNDSVAENCYYYVDDICVSTDSLTCVSEVGIKEAKAIQQINIYPNPTTGIFTLQGATAEIQVYDLFGRLVLRSNNKDIDMSQQPKGVYVLRTGGATRKIVLQ